MGFLGIHKYSLEKGLFKFFTLFGFFVLFFFRIDLFILGERARV